MYPTEIFFDPASASADASPPTVERIPPLSGNDAGFVKSDASATLFPTMGIWAACRIGKYLPAWTDCEPTTARYLPSTAFCPQSAAVLGSFLVSQIVSEARWPSIPSCLFKALTAALAPLAISGVVTPPENSEISINLTVDPEGLAPAVEPPIAKPAVASTTVMTSAGIAVFRRRVLIDCIPPCRPDA